MPPRPRTDPRELLQRLQSAELALRSCEHGTQIFLQVGEREAAALALGSVPASVQQQARCAIDWEFGPLKVTVKRRRR